MGGSEYAGSIAASPYAKEGTKIKPPAAWKEVTKILKRKNDRARRI